MIYPDLIDLLHNLRDYMEDRADVDVDDFERPNQEMRFQNQIKEAIEALTPKNK